MTKRHYRAIEFIDPQNERSAKQTLFYLFIFIGTSLGITTFILYFVKRKCSCDKEPFKITTSHETMGATYDCSVLPDSVWGAPHPKGCPGAVWSDGSASKTYCSGDGGHADDKNKYPWYKQCCQWNSGQCIAKQTPPPPPQKCSAPNATQGVPKECCPDKNYWYQICLPSEDREMKKAATVAALPSCGTVSNPRALATQQIQSQDPCWLKIYRNSIEKFATAGNISVFSAVLQAWRDALTAEIDGVRVSKEMNQTSDVIRNWEWWQYIKKFYSNTRSRTQTESYMKQLAGIQ